MTLADPGLALLLDSDRLSGLVGSPVRAIHVRPKLGVSTVAALIDTADRPIGWIRTLTGDAQAKATKARDRAAEAGHPGQVHEAVIAGRDTMVQWGPLMADPRLARELSVLGLAPPAPDVLLLRYNPLRRVVARVGVQTVRVTVDPHRIRITRVCAAAARTGVPTLTPVAPPPGLPVLKRVSWWPWIEGCDIAAVQEPGNGLLSEVGRILARLHAVDIADTAVLSDLPQRGWDQLRRAADQSVAMLRAVAAGAAGEAERALAQLPVEAPPGTGRLRFSHGDLSRDQYLVPADGGPVVLTDLDRACLAPAVVDLATLLAVDLAEGRVGTEEILAGYAAGGRDPRVPGDWVALVLLARIIEPWRGQASGWFGETVRRALLAGRLAGCPDATEGVIAGAVL